MTRQHARIYDPFGLTEAEKELMMQCELEQEVLEYMKELRNRNQEEMKQQRNDALRPPAPTPLHVNPCLHCGNQEEALEWERYHL